MKSRATMHHVWLFTRQCKREGENLQLIRGFFVNCYSAWKTLRTILYTKSDFSLENVLYGCGGAMRRTTKNEMNEFSFACRRKILLMEKFHYVIQLLLLLKKMDVYLTLLATLLASPWGNCPITSYELMTCETLLQKL